MIEWNLPYQYDWVF